MLFRSDLPPMHFDKTYIENIKSTMPELPEQKRERFKKQFGLDEDSVEFFVSNKDLSGYFEKVISEFDEWLQAEKIKEPKGHPEKLYKLVANYLISDIKGLLAGKEFVEAEFKITPEDFAEFVKMIYKGEMSSKVAKMVIIEMFKTGVDPSTIIDNNKWKQMSDDSELEKIVKDIIAKNIKAVEDYRSGKLNSFQFLVGQVMAATRGTAKPEKVKELLNKFT